jgi:hypothetical protein
VARVAHESSATRPSSRHGQSVPPPWLELQTSTFCATPSGPWLRVHGANVAVDRDAGQRSGSKQMNWLRVLGTAELPHIDQGVRHQFHAKVSLLRVFKTKEEPLEFIFPRKCPIDTSPQCMDSGIKEPLAPSLGSLAVARILFDVGDQAGIENTLSDVLGIKARVKIQIGSCEVQTDRFSHSLQGFQTLWQQEYVRLIDGSHWEWRQHIAMIVGDGYDFLPLLVLVARIPDAISPFLATVLVPSPCSTRTSSFFSSERYPTLAMNACWSDPSSAHLAKAR